MPALLARLDGRLPIYAFPNTIPGACGPPDGAVRQHVRSLRKVFISSVIGLTQAGTPPPSRYVIEAIGVPAGRILFFDDTRENIEGARACGLQVVHVTSDTTVADTLAAMGL